MTTDVIIKKPHFWRRQFARDFTPAQAVFDFLIGIVGPIACLIFDPFVFNGQSV